MSRELGPCPAANDLERLLAEQLSGANRETIESHVEQCTTCQERLERLSGEGAHPATALASSAGPEPEPRADFLRRLRETPLRFESGLPATHHLTEVPLWPKRIGQYEVLEKLGYGGMGAVYKARHVELGKVVALKVLTAGNMDEVRIGRFRNEVRAIGKLDHPNIVAAHDAGEINGVHYLVMDLVDGEDLGRVIKRHGRLNVADACEAIRQAATGLQHAFECGLVHRDIKPSNLMLTRTGRVQLLDLGLARSFRDATADSLTADGMVLGTADYLAPEQWEHAHSADIRADIYSLGCTLYHLLAGKPPYGGRRYGSLLQKLRGHTDTPHAPITSVRPEVPAELAGVIDRMLAKSPADRFATPAGVAAALEPFVSGSDLAHMVGSGDTITSDFAAPDTADVPHTVANSRPRPATRTAARRFALTFALAALAAVVAVVFFIYRPKREETLVPATPIAIEDLHVNHYRGKLAKDLGNIRTSEEIRRGDDVRVFARLNQPAYCYLIAFNPDGTEQLCHPVFEGTDPEKVRTQAPEPVTEVQFFPDDKGYFSLDSAGLQVFVFVVSSKPLPPYAEWRAAVGKFPWRAVHHGGESRWQFDGRDFEMLDQVRGKRTERDPVPSPLRELCEFFKTQSGFNAVRVVAFPVTEQDQASRLKALELDLAREGKYEEAKEPVRELIDLRAKEYGKDHWATLDMKRELQAIERVAALREPDRAEYTRALLQLDESSALQNQGRYPDAVSLAKKGLDVLQRCLGSDSMIAAQVAVHFGNLLRQATKPTEAETVLREALTVIRHAVGEDHPSTASACTGLALVLSEQEKNPDEARKLLDEALDISRRVRGKDHADVAVVLNNLAGHYERQALFGEAEKHYRLALDILIRADGEESRSVATTQHNLASMLTKRGRYTEGETLNREVLRVRRQMLPDGHPDIAMTCNNLAYNLDLQGRHAVAEEFYREVLAIYRRRFGAESSLTAMAGNGLALNLQNQGKFDDAGTLLENSLRIFTAAGFAKSRSAATTHNNLAANLRGQRRYDLALEQSEKGLAILRDILGETHPDVAQCYNNLAAILDDQMKYADAEKQLRKALAIFEARLNNDHPQTVLTRSNLAVNLHNQSKYAEAESGLRESLESHRRLYGEGNPSTAWTYKNLVTNCWARGDYRGAAELGPAASASFEAARRQISFTGLDRVRRTDELSPLRHLAASAARIGQMKDAWKYLESSLARGLFDDLSTRPLTEEEQAREQNLVRDLEGLNNEIAGLAKKSAAGQSPTEFDKLRRERDEVQARFVKLQTDLARKYGVSAGRVYDLASIQKALPPDAALIAWLDITGDDTFKDPNGEHWVCVVRQKGDPAWVQLQGAGPDKAWQDSDEEITKSVRGQLALRANAPKADWQAASDQVYRQRLKPIEASLAAHDDMSAVRRLVVLPSSRMASIPVEALTERFIVSYAPSATMLAWLNDKLPAAASDPMGRRSLLALGDPDFRPGSFARLPATRSEVHAIARLFSRSELLLGPAASEQNLERMAANRELVKFRFLHFATHGVLDERRPLASALQLAQQPGDATPLDGRLTADHILRTWKLDAELVTLSACETALGKYSSGEGYLGFSQALFRAGARSMVLSLWPVDDRATTLVMTRFYENMLGTPDGREKGLPKAEALAEAKRWLAGLTASEVDRLTADVPRGLPSGTRGVRRDADAPPPGDAPRPFAHPSYWSAFILIGDPR